MKIFRAILRKLNFPLTIRGLLLTLLAIYCLAVPVRLNIDIIAAGFAVCSIALILFFLSLAYLTKRKLNRSLSVSLSFDANEEQSSSTENFAGEPLSLLAKITGSKLDHFLNFIFVL